MVVEGSLTSQMFQGLPGEAVAGPFVVHRHGPQRVIEADRGSIPLEQRPFDAAMVMLDGVGCQCLHERLAASGPTGFGTHVEVLEVGAVTSLPDGVVEEPQRESVQPVRSVLRGLGQMSEDRRRFTEEVLVELLSRPCDGFGARS